MHGKAVMTRLVLRLVTEVTTNDERADAGFQTHSNDVLALLDCAPCATGSSGAKPREWLRRGYTQGHESVYCLWRRDDGGHYPCGLCSRNEVCFADVGACNTVASESSLSVLRDLAVEHASVRVQ